MSPRPGSLIEKVTPDRLLLAATMALVAVGTVMVFTASAPMAAENFGSPDFFLRRQAMRVGMGLLAMLVLMRLDYNLLKKWPARCGLLLAVLFLIFTLVKSFGLSAGLNRGSMRRVEMGFLGFQPAEIARLALVVYLADWLSRKRDTLGDYVHGFLPPVLVTLVMTVLVLKQPSMGGAIAIFALGLSLLFLAGARVKHILLTALPLIPLAAWKILETPYQLRRFFGFLHPTEDLAGTGWQIWQSMGALATGGLSGIGLGESRARFYFLPDAHTDFILSIVGEELGFLGICLIMGLFLFFIARGMWVAVRAPDLFGFLLAAGITFSVAINWAINVAVVARLMPVTGQPLPFVSFGGSSLFIHLIGVGLLLSVSRVRRLRHDEWAGGRNEDWAFRKNRYASL